MGGEGGSVRLVEFLVSAWSHENMISNYAGTGGGRGGVHRKLGRIFSKCLESESYVVIPPPTP